MSIKIVAEVLDHAGVGISPAERLLLIALADRASDDYRLAWPGIGELMRRTGVSRTSLYEYVKNLQRHGYLTRVSDEEKADVMATVGMLRTSTVLWRINPVEQWGGPDSGQQGVRISDSGGPDSGLEPLLEPLEGNHQLHTREPHARNERKTKSPSASTRGHRLRRSPPESARAADLGEAPNRLVKKPRAERVPTYNTVPALVRYFNETVAVALQVAVTRNDDKLRGNMALWLKRGVSHADIKDCIDLYALGKYRLKGYRDQTTFILRFQEIYDALPAYRQAMMTEDERVAFYAAAAATPVANSFDDPKWQALAKEYGLL